MCWQRSRIPGAANTPLLAAAITGAGSTDALRRSTGWPPRLLIGWNSLAGAVLAPPAPGRLWKMPLPTRVFPLKVFFGGFSRSKSGNRRVAAPIHGPDGPGEPVNTCAV